MKRFTPDNARNKEHHHKPRTSGPIKPPTPKPFIRLYHGFLKDPKPEDHAGYYLIHSEIPVDPDKLEIALRKEKQKSTVVVFMTQEQGNRNLFVYMDREYLWADIDRKTRKIIEAMQSADK